LGVIKPALSAIVIGLAIHTSQLLKTWGSQGTGLV
jgi:hypothetical protein